MNYSFLPRTSFNGIWVPEAVVTFPSVDNYSWGGCLQAHPPTFPLSLSFLLCSTNMHIFFSTPLGSFLLVLHPYFHITSTHTFRANKPCGEDWLVNRKKKPPFTCDYHISYIAPPQCLRLHTSKLMAYTALLIGLVRNDKEMIICCDIFKPECECSLFITSL